MLKGENTGINMYQLSTLKCEPLAPNNLVLPSAKLPFASVCLQIAWVDGTCQDQEGAEGDHTEDSERRADRAQARKRKESRIVLGTRQDETMKIYEILTKMIENRTAGRLS